MHSFEKRLPTSVRTVRSFQIPLVESWIDLERWVYHKKGGLSKRLRASEGTKRRPLLRWRPHHARLPPTGSSLPPFYPTNLLSRRRRNKPSKRWLLQTKISYWIIKATR
ncbi:unnamed protein product [Ectocarpus sp. 4 AP-2014]